MKELNINLIKSEVAKISNVQQDDIRVVPMYDTKKVHIFLMKDVDGESITATLYDHIRECDFSRIDIFSIPQWEVVNNG